MADAYRDLGNKWDHRRNKLATSLDGLADAFVAARNAFVEADESLADELSAAPAGDGPETTAGGEPAPTSDGQAGTVDPQPEVTEVAAPVDPQPTTPPPEPLTPVAEPTTSPPEPLTPVAEPTREESAD